MATHGCSSSSVLVLLVQSNVLLAMVLLRVDTCPILVRLTSCASHPMMTESVVHLVAAAVWHRVSDILQRGKGISHLPMLLVVHVVHTVGLLRGSKAVIVGVVMLIMAAVMMVVVLLIMRRLAVTSRGRRNHLARMIAAMLGVT